MKKLIVVRCGELTGFLQPSPDMDRQALNGGGKRRIRKAALSIRTLLPNKKYCLLAPDIYPYKRAVRFLAKGIGRVRPSILPALGNSESADSVRSVLQCVSELADQYDTVIALFGKRMANLFPIYFGMKMPGAFPIYLYRPLYRAEVLHVDLEHRSYEILNTPIGLES